MGRQGIGVNGRKVYLMVMGCVNGREWQYCELERGRLVMGVASG